MIRNSVIATVVTLLLTFSTLAQGLDEAQKKECLKVSKRTLKVMMKAFSECNDKLKFHLVSGEEYQKKVGCVVKCVMKSVNMLDDSDMATDATLKKAIESQVPAEFVQHAHETLNVCLKEHKLDPKDENCKSYLDMGTCMQGAAAEICGSTPMI